MEKLLIFRFCMNFHGMYFSPKCKLSGFLMTCACEYRFTIAFLCVDKYHMVNMYKIEAIEFNWIQKLRSHKIQVTSVCIFVFIHLHKLKHINNINLILWNLIFLINIIYNIALRSVPFFGVTGEKTLKGLWFN